MPTPNRGQLLIYLFLLCLHLHSLLSYVPSFLSFLHSYPLTSTLLPPSFLTDLSLPLPLLGQCRVSIRQHQSASSPSLTRCFLLLKIPPLPLLPSSPPLSLTRLFLSLFWARAESGLGTNSKSVLEHVLGFCPRNHRRTKTALLLR